MKHDRNRQSALFRQYLEKYEDPAKKRGESIEPYEPAGARRPLNEWGHGGSGGGLETANAIRDFVLRTEFGPVYEAKKKYER